LVARLSPQAGEDRVHCTKVLKVFESKHFYERFWFTFAKHVSYSAWIGLRVMRIQLFGTTTDYGHCMG